MDVGKSRHKKCVGIKIVSPRQGHLAKSADIWLLGRHVANMSATFSAKLPAPFAYARRLVAVAAQSTNPGVICVSKKSFGHARERDGSFFLQVSEGCPSS